MDGYNAYFSFCKTKKGYSGEEEAIYRSRISLIITVCMHAGVVTFCRNSVATPIAAEEGLTGILSPNKDAVIGSYGDHSDFTEDEVINLKVQWNLS